MPALPPWMDSTRWQPEPSYWATAAYNLLAPRVNVRGRMALLMLLIVISAFGWLLWRAYCVIQTPNDDLVEKLGLDIPPAPLLTLEEIGPRELQLTWKHNEHYTTVQEHIVEVNGKVVGSTRKNELGAVISNLVPGNTYDVRVFCQSSGQFQTPSIPLRIRTPGAASTSSHDGDSDSPPTVRAIAVRPPSVVMPSAAVPMTRELSGGQPLGRRGTTGRRPSPAAQPETPNREGEGHKPVEDEVDGDLAELSQRFQKVQQDIDAVEALVQDEDKEFDDAFKELEAKRDELKQGLKERDEASNDLRKQVHKAESASRTAQNEKTKKERLLQNKENSRRKRKDEMSKWQDQIASMKEEIAGIETQKAAIERRKQLDLTEYKRKMEEEQKEVAMLEEDNKEKALQIKVLEEERQQLNTEDETDESREADRLDRERDMRWRARFDQLQQTYARLWQELQLATQQVSYTREQINQLENRRQQAMQFTPLAPLDMDAVRRGMVRPGIPARRIRQAGSHGSSISSPRGPFAGPEPFPAVPQYTTAATASPTNFGPSYFNPTNGMSLVIPTESRERDIDESDPVSSIPMSPRADSLLPADLLGDESADDLPDADLSSQAPKPADISPFPRIGSPVINEEPAHPASPSLGSSSAGSFASPRETFVPAAVEGDRDSSNSGDQVPDRPDAAAETVEEAQQPKSRNYMSMFGLNRQRGKTLADQPPLLGSLKPGQSQSFPRNMDEFDPSAQPRRRMSYGGNWAFPGGLLQRGGSTQEDSPARDQESRLSSSRRGFNFPSFGKSAAPSAAYDPFAARSGSLDPGFRGESSSPRPASVYSFDKMPRPSMESQLRVWNVDKPAMRNSPLAPEWGSLHSFSRSHSRRPSVVYGSTSNPSLAPDEEIVEDRKPSRPLQAPIGTRPASQQTSTPKLNPAAPSFTMFFSKRSEKSSKDKGKPGSKEKPLETESASPPESRKSKDTSSIAATVSTIDSDTLDRTASATSAQPSFDSTPIKPNFISKITRKASSNKFGSWKDKGGALFSRKETITPNGEIEEGGDSSEQLGRSLESMSTTPSGDGDRAKSRSSINWNFMRKSKKGKEDLTASEISESSERASETGDETQGDGDDDDEESLKG